MVEAEGGWAGEDAAASGGEESGEWEHCGVNDGAERERKEGF